MHLARNTKQVQSGIAASNEPSSHAKWHQDPGQVDLQQVSSTNKLNATVYQAIDPALHDYWHDKFAGCVTKVNRGWLACKGNTQRARQSPACTALVEYSLLSVAVKQHCFFGKTPVPLLIPS
jgi:hypothetical protein